VDTLKQLLEDWNEKPSNPLLRDHRTMSDAEDLVNALQLELAAKEEVIKVLHNDIRWYRKDWNTSMIQDQGLREE